MSIKTGKKAGVGLYLLPLAAAAPFAAAMAFAVSRVWPSVHKVASILIKLVVKT